MDETDDTLGAAVIVAGGTTADGGGDGTDGAAAVTDDVDDTVDELEDVVDGGNNTREADVVRGTDMRALAVVELADAAPSLVLAERAAAMLEPLCCADGAGARKDASFAFAFAFVDCCAFCFCRCSASCCCLDC